MSKSSETNSASTQSPSTQGLDWKLEYSGSHWPVMVLFCFRLQSLLFRGHYSSRLLVCNMDCIYFMVCEDYYFYKKFQSLGKVTFGIHTNVWVTSYDAILWTILLYIEFLVF